MTPDISQGHLAAEKALLGERSVIIRGPVGSGLHTLANQLAHEHENVALVELLDLEEPDAAVAGLLQALAAVPDGQVRQGLLTLLPQTGNAAQAIARALGEAKRSLVVLVPPSWANTSEEEDDGRRARCRALLRGLATAPRLVLLSDLQVDPAELGLPNLPEVKLPVHEVRLDADAPGWRDYAPGARQLQHALAGHTASPLVWRLAVGALALGVPLAQVQELCLRPAASALGQLVPLLASRIKSTPGLTTAVRRALRVRRRLPVEVLATVAGIPSGHGPLLTECLGYGDPVRISPVLRARLLSELGARELSLEKADLLLAEHYRTLDGVASPSGVQAAAQMTAWVERVHHLAWAGEQGSQAWQQLELPSPEFYWDRARALSIRYKDYEGAARLYLSCLERFPEDDYSHHYAAWNLEKAGKHAALSREHYQAAVELAPDNPWWNARYVSFLIRSGERSEARGAWCKALHEVDPDGTATARRPWLASHLHFWVAQAWLEARHWREAQRVLEGVPLDIQQHSERKFLQLAAAIDQAKEQECARLETWLAQQPGAAWELAETLWRELSQQLRALPPPAAGPGEDGRAQLAWSLPELYVEVEVDESGIMSWYARDLRTRRSEAGEFKGIAWSPELARWLEQVAHA